ncbi:MAG TPA: hypothetical protein VGC42_05025, partial [Kofleriaceae bacterium]
DAADGQLRLWSRADERIIDTDARHTNIAFGISWLNNQACSAGLDGHVLCASPDGNMQELPGDSEPVPWISSTTKHDGLIIARADGSIREFNGSMTTLYSHADAPYRMAVSVDDRLLASGANDGSVIIYDLLQHKQLYDFRPHAGLVTNVAWRDHDLWTAGRDGTIRHWIVTPRGMRSVATTTERGPARLFQLTRAGWIVNVDERILAISEARDQVTTRIDLGRRAEHVDVDHDVDRVVAASSDEVIVIDLAHHRLASVPLWAGGAGYVGFSGPDEIAISTEAGLFLLKPSQLSYNSYQ